MNNPTDNLDFTSFSRALASFKRALDEYEKDKSNEFVRDSCIQRFEYCYSLSTKFLERYLSLISADPVDIKTMSFPNLVREGYSKGLLQHSWDQWIDYRKARNSTSHAYNEAKALEVMKSLDAFYLEAAYLLNAMQHADET
jgi:nucleotidyltransferase substrate binding protein (TIGR01987 family)